MRVMDSRRGVTMVGALVAFMLLGIAILVMSKSFSAFSRGTGRLDRKVKGAALLNRTANALVETDYQSLITLCNSKNAFKSDISGNCTLASGQLNRNLASPANSPPATMEVLRDWDGNSTTQGVSCAQLERCEHLGGGHLLLVKLRAYWLDPSANDQMMTGILSLRRVAW